MIPIIKYPTIYCLHGLPNNVTGFNDEKCVLITNNVMIIKMHIKYNKIQNGFVIVF